MPGCCVGKIVVAHLMLGVVACASACDSPGGRRTTGWRFGPSERPSRSAEAAVITPSPRDTQAPAVITPPTTSVSKSALRERALTLLQSMATGGSPEERSNALEALSATPARLSGVVEPALTDESPGLRAVAAMVVGKSRYEGAGELLMPLAKDQSWMVRSAGIYALKRTGKPVDPTALATMLTDRAPRIRAQAAFILGELGEPSALGPLREAARENLSRANAAEARIMELQIAEARVKLGDESALADIRTALFPARSEDLEATALACQIVGQVKDQASVNQLINLTKQKDDAGAPMPAEIRLAAAGALAKMGRQPRNASAIGREYVSNSTDAVRAQAAYVLGESGDLDALPMLEQLLADQVGRVRVSAAAAIAKMTSSRG